MEKNIHNTIPNSFRFFKNTECRYYPCHKGIEEMNCMFCFCPLYLFKNCGGNFSYTEKGIKDCSKCLVPHQPEGYDYVSKKLCEGNLQEKMIEL